MSPTSTQVPDRITNNNENSGNKRLTRESTSKANQEIGDQLRMFTRQNLILDISSAIYKKSFPIDTTIESIYKKVTHHKNNNQNNHQLGILPPHGSLYV